MMYVKKIFSSLREILILMILQYAILIICYFIFGGDRATKYSSIMLLLFQIGYIVYYFRKEDMQFKIKKNYIFFIFLGISLAIIYNMVIFKIGLISEANKDVSIILNIISSAIIGPIFEEIVFRYKLIKNLEKFNKKIPTILLSGIIFGILHINLITIIYASIIGFINSFLYLKYKNIFIPIIIHISGNMIVNFLFSFNGYILLLGVILFIISLLGIKRIEKTAF